MCGIGPTGRIQEAIGTMRGRVRGETTWAIVMLLGQLVIGSGCATGAQAPFIWVDAWQEPQPPPSAGEYVIGVGDALNIQVWEQEKMSARVRVRTDGQVSLPFLNDVPAAGMTPVFLARNLEGRLKQFIVTPQVTVAVEEARALSVSVLGQVGIPGLHSLDPGAGVAQALAAAGGLRDFAQKDRIFVLRAGERGETVRLRMTYDDVTAGRGRAATLRLRAGDVVVVE
jgi:polysaccharide export outer membrane protein